MTASTRTTAAGLRWLWCALLSALLGTVLLGGCAGVREAARPQALGPSLSVQLLAEGVWLFREAAAAGEDANGLLVQSGGEALLAGVPERDTSAARLLRWAALSLGTPVRRAVLTHAEQAAGLAVLQAAGVATYALPEAAERTAALGRPRPDSLLAPEQALPVGRRTVIVFYPGPGAAPGNLVLWLDRERLLFGGPLVQAAKTRTLAPSEGADLDAWPAALRQVIARFPEAALVVPARGAVGGQALFEHTLALLRAYPAALPD